LVHHDIFAVLTVQARTVEQALRSRMREPGYEGSDTLALWEHGRWRRLLYDEQVRIPAVLATLVLALLTYLTWAAQNSKEPNNDSPLTEVSRELQQGLDRQLGDLRQEFAHQLREVKEQQRALSEQQKAWNEQQQKSPPTPAEAGFSVVRATVGYTIWVGGAVAIVLIAGGIFLLARGSGLAKWAGSVALLAGASLGGFAVIKDVKIQDVVKFGGPIFESSRAAASNIYVDKIALENNVSDLLIKLLSQKPMPEGSRFNAKRIGGVSQFPIGKAQIATALKKDELEGVCAQAADAGRLYLVVGSTDRLPLSGEIQRQYDANVGLAMARANAVRQYMIDHCWPDRGIGDNVVLSLVAGPQQTPPGAPNDPAGSPRDRSVDVYTLSIGDVTDSQQTRPTRDTGTSPQLLEPIGQQQGLSR
jgi:flagellar motor protein MotB